MRLIIRAAQALDGHVCIDLRRRKAGVPEQRLHAAQICACIEQVRGKGMPQLVRADRYRDAGVPDITF